MRFIRSGKAKTPQFRTASKNCHATDLMCLCKVTSFPKTLGRYCVEITCRCFLRFRTVPSYKGEQSCILSPGLLIWRVSCAKSQTACRVLNIDWINLMPSLVLISGLWLEEMVVLGLFQVMHWANSAMSNKHGIMAICSVVDMCMRNYWCR